MQTDEERREVAQTLRGLSEGDSFRRTHARGILQVTRRDGQGRGRVLPVVRGED